MTAETAGASDTNNVNDVVGEYILYSRFYWISTTIKREVSVLYHNFNYSDLNC